MGRKTKQTQEEMSLYENICSNLKLMRNIQGLNMLAVSKIINVSHQQYAKYEAGHNQIGICKLKTLIDYYNKACSKKYSIDDYVRNKIFYL